MKNNVNRNFLPGFQFKTLVENNLYNSSAAVLSRLSPSISCSVLKCPK